VAVSAAGPTYLGLQCEAKLFLKNIFSAEKFSGVPYSVSAAVGRGRAAVPGVPPCRIQ
jgi:hypothetical protein